MEWTSERSTKHRTEAIFSIQPNHVRIVTNQLRLELVQRRTSFSLELRVLEDANVISSQGNRSSNLVIERVEFQMILHSDQRLFLSSFIYSFSFFLNCKLSFLCFTLTLFRNTRFWL